MTQAFNLSQLANNIDSSGRVDATDGLVNAVPVANGGTGASDASAARTNLGAPSVSGSGATGTWGISISGNAATATNATNATNANYATTAGNGGVTSVNGQIGSVTISATPTTDQVLNATAGASTGAVGTYAFLGETGLVATDPGGTRPGSALRYAGLIASIAFSNTAVSQYGSTAFTGTTITPAGTWRAMGRAFSYPASGENPPTGYGATLWLRIS